jgi:hypothetical protein
MTSPNLRGGVSSEMWRSISSVIDGTSPAILPFREYREARLPVYWSIELSFLPKAN